MERCQQLIKELQEQLQASARSEEQMRSMAEESQCELQELKSQHRRLSEQVSWCSNLSSFVLCDLIICILWGDMETC